MELLPRIGVFAASFVLLIFSGCESSDNSEMREYVDSFLRVPLVTEGTTEAQLELKRNTDGASDTETIAAVREFVERSMPQVKEFAANYRALHPPEQIRWEHAVFVQALDNFVAALERLVAALDGVDSRQEALLVYFREIEPAQRALERSCWSLERVADEEGFELRCGAFDLSSPEGVL